MKKNTLTQIRDDYNGPWPRTLLRLFLIIVGGQAIVYFYRGEITLMSVLGGLSVVTVLVITGYFIKRHAQKRNSAQKLI